MASSLALTFFSHCETICSGQFEYVWVAVGVCVYMCALDIGVR